MITKICGTCNNWLMDRRCSRVAGSRTESGPNELCRHSPQLWETISKCEYYKVCTQRSNVGGICMDGSKCPRKPDNVI